MTTQSYTNKKIHSQNDAERYTSRKTETEIRTDADRRKHKEKDIHRERETYRQTD